ncbi:hypothetical protein I79_018550 [Cricetulus griseus]|uniref:Uncharacterized protein n=1 Tax=Cricetulus griseus TaxID=10029 RepID=G3I509_CRIGR|nr:hypothetical protein I79_018550 [Cricetulus griseus]
MPDTQGQGMISSLGLTVAQLMEKTAEGQHLRDLECPGAQYTGSLILGHVRSGDALLVGLWSFTRG